VGGKTSTLDVFIDVETDLNFITLSPLLTFVPAPTYAFPAREDDLMEWGLFG
jgi:hypothetical protein